jgi:hypothetical protein
MGGSGRELGGGKGMTKTRIDKDDNDLRGDNDCQ